MFQIEPVLWLQSIGSPPLTWLLSGVTLLGYTHVYVVLLLVLVFAIRLRPGLAVIGGFLLIGLLTEGFKNGMTYPRPDELDDRAKRTFETTPIELPARGGPTRFWSLPQSETVAAVRSRAAGNYGFPSGHVGAATTFLLCAALFFGSRRMLIFAAFWIPLMALSRMYLGRHFLGDVLGGFVLGVFAVTLTVLLFRAASNELLQRRDRRARAALAPVTLLSLLLLVLAPYEPLLQPEYVGALAGLVISYAFLHVTGTPRDGGSLRQRALRVAAGGLVFLVACVAAEGLLELLGRPGPRMFLLGATLVVSTVAIAGTVALCRRLGLYEDAD
jgi:membrane-associated phospholipid phosphatase